MEFLLPESRSYVLQNLVPCPTLDPNLVEDRTAVARDIFDYFCPRGAGITGIFPMRNTEKHKCVWSVRYIQNVLFERDRSVILHQIKQVVPRNTEIVLEKHVYVPPIIVIDYSIKGCDCVAGRPYKELPEDLRELHVPIYGFPGEDRIVDDFCILHKMYNLNIEDDP